MRGKLVSTLETANHLVELVDPHNLRDTLSCLIRSAKDSERIAPSKYFERSRSENVRMPPMIPELFRTYLKLPSLPWEWTSPLHLAPHAVMISAEITASSAHAQAGSSQPPGIS